MCALVLEVLGSASSALGFAKEIPFSAGSKSSNLFLELIILQAMWGLKWDYLRSSKQTYFIFP